MMKKVNTPNVKQTAAEDSEQASVTGEKEFSYGYYSKVLNKPFDTLEELCKEEQEFLAVEEAKKQAAEQRKSDAANVEKAFKELNVAKRTYNEITAKAYSDYLEKAKALEEEYNTTLKNANNELADKQDLYNKTLKAFINAHPEGYHLTLKDGDNVVTYNAGQVNKAADQEQAIIDVMKLFRNIFKF